MIRNEGVLAATASVRLIDHGGSHLGVVTTDKALSLAKQVGLDLLLVSPQATPPVARILDFAAYLRISKEREGECNCSWCYCDHPET